MRTKEEKQALYKERQRQMSKDALARENSRKKREERNLMHKAVLLVGDNLEARAVADDREAMIKNNPSIIDGPATKVIE